MLVQGGMRRSNSNTGKGFDLITTPPPPLLLVVVVVARATTTIMTA